jgi:hypothetical protein
MTLEVEKVHLDRKDVTSSRRDYRMMMATVSGCVPEDTRNALEEGVEHRRTIKSLVMFVATECRCTKEDVLAGTIDEAVDELIGRFDRLVGIPDSDFLRQIVHEVVEDVRRMNNIPNYVHP